MQLCKCVLIEVMVHSQPLKCAGRKCPPQVTLLQALSLHTCTLTFDLCTHLGYKAEDHLLVIVEHEMSVERGEQSLVLREVLLT